MNLTHRAKRHLKKIVKPTPPPPYPPPQSKWSPPWAEILQRDKRIWKHALRASKDGPHILIATSFGGHPPSTIIESTLAIALTLRGARVDLLLCDEALAACQQLLLSYYAQPEKFLSEGPDHFCNWCFKPAFAVYKSLGLTVHRYTDFLDTAAQERAEQIAQELPIEKISEFTLDGIAVGEHALAGALRFFARGDLEDSAVAHQVLRRYLEAALQTTFATNALITQHKYVSACFNHGIYVPQGLIGEVARKQTVRVVNWTPGYRKQRFIFTHNETYHHALMTEPVTNWENIEWSKERTDETMDYLTSRWQGTNDWIWFHEKPEHELRVIASELEIDFNKPIIGLLTNVMWDAQLHYPANAFPNMRDWILRTISYFATRPDMQLVIRVHPAEIRGTVPTRQPIVDEIKNAFPELPSNVFVIPPESNISTYAIMLQSNAVLIYGTKTGVELTSFGIPVIVAGEAWIRNKGITLDAKSAAHYFELLDTLPLSERLDERTRERALKYAYHFFFRRMIPLEMSYPTEGWPPYGVRVESLDELAPGASAGLDVVCEGILNGSEFIYPAEKLTGAVANYFDE